MQDFSEGIHVDTFWTPPYFCQIFFHFHAVTGIFYQIISCPLPFGVQAAPLLLANPGSTPDCDCTVSFEAKLSKVP